MPDFLGYVNGLSPGWTKKHPIPSTALATAVLFIPLTWYGSWWFTNEFTVKDLEEKNAALTNKVLLLESSVAALEVANEKMRDQINVQSKNQSGGITAGTINVGEVPLPPRELTDSLKQTLRSWAGRHKTSYVLLEDQFDAESKQFGIKISEFLNQEGFTVNFWPGTKYVRDDLEPSKEGVAITKGMDFADLSQAATIVMVLVQRR